jgi:hypothetical protein
MAVKQDRWDRRDKLQDLREVLLYVRRFRAELLVNIAYLRILVDICLKYLQIIYLWIIYL